jgi:hypothetical protein
MPEVDVSPGRHHLSLFDARTGPEMLPLKEDRRLPPRLYVRARVEPYRGAVRWRCVHPSVGARAIEGAHVGVVALLCLLTGASHL